VAERWFDRCDYLAGPVGRLTPVIRSFNLRRAPAGSRSDGRFWRDSVLDADPSPAVWAFAVAGRFMGLGSS